jgi:hypothetical protein
MGRDVSTSARHDKVGMKSKRRGRFSLHETSPRKNKIASDRDKGDVQFEFCPKSIRGSGNADEALTPEKKKPAGVNHFATAIASI